MSQVRIGTKEYEFDFSNPSNREAMAVERVFDGTFKQWAEAVRDGSITALTCLVYVLEKRDDPNVKFSDVEFNISDFDVVDADADKDDDDEAKVAEAVGEAN